MPPSPSKTTSAVRKLELSQQTSQSIQKELMGTDIDFDKFVLYLSSQVQTDLVNRITGASVTRSIEQASSLKVTVNDYDRALLTSGRLTDKLDVEIDGLWFRLAGVDKTGNDLELTFEEREVAILRNYTKWKIARRSKTTRAEFVLNLIREVREFTIPVYIPELHKPQPIEKFDGDLSGKDVVVNMSKGVPTPTPQPSTATPPGLLVTNVPGPKQANPLTIKGAKATPEQLQNANIILQVGDSMGVSRRLHKAAIMVAIVESTIINLPGGDRDSAGLFQQRASWGSYEDRTDPETSSRMFYQAAIKKDAEFPTVELGTLCQLIQNSAYPDRYAYYGTEAERFVTAYGIPPGKNTAAANAQSAAGPTNGEYFFYRGSIVDRSGTPHRKPESSWTCIQRLAGDVDWRAFFVSGTFYFVSEDDLLTRKPALYFDEFADGITEVDGSYDRNKKSATLSFKARIGRWDAPIGSVVAIENMGPWTGRWIVAEYERNLLVDTEATVTLTKARPALPEPITSNKQGIIAGWMDQPSQPTSTYVNTGTSLGGYTNPLGTLFSQTSVFSMVVPYGAPDVGGILHHAAYDWYAPGGTPVVAPCDGKIVEITPSSGDSGRIYGGVVKIEESSPNKGYIWVFRHVNPTPTPPYGVGSLITAGTQIATVVRWADKPSSSHCHIEIWRTLAGGYRYENMVDPVEYLMGRSK